MEEQDWTQVVIARNVQLPVQGGELRDATTPVSGAWGSGRLLHTSLGNVLFLSDGRVAAGFVSPMSAILVGVGAGAFCYLAVVKLKPTSSPLAKIGTQNPTSGP